MHNSDEKVCAEFMTQFKKKAPLQTGISQKKQKKTITLIQQLSSKFAAVLTFDRVDFPCSHDDSRHVTGRVQRL